jgi:hypothetical protein
MEQQLSLHLKKFNDRIKVMNQTNAKDLNLSAQEARQIHADIFDLLNKINDITTDKKAKAIQEAVVLNLDGGNF